MFLLLKLLADKMASCRAVLHKEGQFLIKNTISFSPNTDKVYAFISDKNFIKFKYYLCDTKLACSTPIQNTKQSIKNTQVLNT